MTEPTPTATAGPATEPAAAPVGPPAVADAPTSMSPRDRVAVAILLASTFVVILNETIMGVALPRLMTDLDITAATAQWVSTAFMLTMAVVIPVTGFVLQRVTTRAAFAAAMGLFSLGTLVSALAPGFEVLVVGRVVQASGTAIMLPLLMTTVMTVTPPASRGRTMGNISVVISVAPAIGPTISGLVLTVLPWRALFAIVLPVALLALGAGLWRLPTLNEPRYARVDLLSVVLSALAFGGVVLGLSRFGEVATGGVLAAWLPLGVGLVSLSVFVARQLWLQRSDAALLDLRVFASPTYSVSVGLMGLSMLGLFGTIILLPIYTQRVLGLDVLGTGLLMLPGGLIMGLLAPGVGRLYDRVGARPLLVPAAAVVSLSLWGMTLFGQETPPWYVLACHVALSVGLALTFTPLFTAALGAVPQPLYSHGSAAVGTVQQVAGAAGTALFVTVLTATTISSRADGAGDVAATAAGVHAAFLVGAVISLVAIPTALAVRAAPAAATAHG